MRKILFFTITIFLTASVTLKSQSIELADLAHGNLVGFGTIYPESKDMLCDICIDKERELYGYYQVVDMGEVRKGISKYEYTLYDKNLNPYANLEFEDLKFNDKKHLASFNFFKVFNDRGRLLLLRSQSNLFSVIQYYREIDDKANTLSDPFFINPKSREESAPFQITERKEVLELDKKHTKDDPDEELVEEYHLGSGHLAIFYKEKTRKNNHVYYIRLHDNDGNRIFEKVFESPSDNYSVSFLKADEEANTVLLYKYDYSYHPKTAAEPDMVLFWVMDLNDGSIIKEIEYSANKTPSKEDIYQNRTYLKIFDNRMVQVLVVQKGNDGISFILNALDISDMRNPALKTKEVPYTDLTFLNVVKNNRVKDDDQKNHFINVVDYFFKDNGNILVLMKENLPQTKKKGQYVFSLDYLFDYHLVEYDRDFNFVGHTPVTNRDFGKRGAPIEYMNSMYTDNSITFSTLWLNEKKPVARENLFASPDYNFQHITFFNYEDGEIKSSKLPLKREGAKISIMNAKKGYILIREYSDDGKIDEVRLEKLAF